MLCDGCCASMLNNMRYRIEFQSNCNRDFPTIVSMLQQITSARDLLRSDTNSWQPIHSTQHTAYIPLFISTHAYDTNRTKYNGRDPICVMT